MSDNKYPYIGENTHGVKFLVYSKNSALILNSVNKGKRHTTYLERKYKNITHEYLTNTYGKCESQEHADFICELAEGAGFEVGSYKTDRSLYFCFAEVRLVFFEDKVFASSNDEKLIHLPLPPKEKEMSETKPVYTKEMHKRGKLPPIGSDVIFKSVDDYKCRVIGYSFGEVDGVKQNPSVYLENEKLGMSFFNFSTRYILPLNS